MTLRQFHRALRRLGPALDAWPAPERVAARALLARSRRARLAYLHVLEDDDSLGAPLDPARQARLAATLRARLVAPAPRWRPEWRPEWRAMAAPAPLWGALAACALLGVWAGTPDQTATRPAATPIFASMQMTAFDPPWPEGTP